MGQNHCNTTKVRKYGRKLSVTFRCQAFPVVFAKLEQGQPGPAYRITEECEDLEVWASHPGFIHTWVNYPGWNSQFIGYSFVNLNLCMLNLVTFRIEGEETNHQVIFLFFFLTRTVVLDYVPQKGTLPLREEGNRIGRNRTLELPHSCKKDFIQSLDSSEESLLQARGPNLVLYIHQSLHKKTAHREGYKP